MREFTDVSIERGPDLPMLKHKVGRSTYEYPDLSVLNETAVYFVEKALKCLGDNPDLEFVAFSVPDQFSEQARRAIRVAMAMCFEARIYRGGWHGFCLFTGSAYSPEEHTVEFEVMEHKRWGESVRKARGKDGRAELRDVVIAYVEALEG